MQELFRDVTILDCSPGALASAHGMPVCDSRRVYPGCVFTSIKGNGEDGHGHIFDAVKKGAAVIVTERDVSFQGAEYVRVPDTRAAFAAMCNAACGCPADGMRLVAATGTNGKSSVVALLERIFSSCGLRTRTLGTITHQMTTLPPELLYPELKRMRELGTECVAMEASSHALVQDRLSPLRFEVGIYTNLTREHLDYHKTMEAYAEAKRRLFSLCTLGLFCGDSEYPRLCAAEEGRRRFIYGTRDCDFAARDVISSYNGSRYIFASPFGEYNVELPLVGGFQVLNSLAALSCACLMGMDARDAASSLAEMGQINGRLEEIDTGEHGFRVFIDFAHTPDAMENAVTSLRQCMKTERRLWVIFGCGGERDKTKRPLMGECAATLADIAVITSDNPRSEDPLDIIKDITAGFRRCGGKAKMQVIPDRRAAVSYAIAEAKEGDVLLFCGKGHEEYYEDRRGRTPYCERNEILKNLR